MSTMDGYNIMAENKKISMGIFASGTTLLSSIMQKTNQNTQSDIDYSAAH